MVRRVLLDTVFIQALLNRRDQYHSQAKSLFPQVKEAQEVWITEAVLVEVGNALSAFNRDGAVRFIRQCYETPNINVVSVDTRLLEEALVLYGERRDKEWGLTDCISFVVMRQRDLTAAVTADEHFVQAGFRVLMLSEGA
ncbi:MAG: type II toxin-antitoxin system VapC family toxin [bacterium]|nr:type II toxin-antitoxin system VapC family toxin [bacterium]